MGSSRVACALVIGGFALPACTYDYDGAARCTNGSMDGTETNVDCGGDCLACFGDVCSVAGDCVEGACENGHCSAPPSKTRRTWQTIAPSFAPSSRYGAALAPLAANAKGLVLTGGVRQGNFLGDTWILNDQQWTQTKAPALPRAFLGMVHRGDAGGPFAFGGQETNLVTTSEAYAWNPQSASWAPDAPALPENRARFATARDDAGGRTFVFGGIKGDPNGPTSNDLLILTDASAAWDKRQADTTPGTSWPGKRYDLAMAFAPNAGESGTLVLFGGRTSAKAGSDLDDTWVYDETGFRRIEGAGPSKRHGHVMAYDADTRRVVLFGGSDGDKLGDTWEFDAAAEEWIEIQPTGDNLVIGQGWGAAMSHEPTRHRTVMFGGETSSNNAYQYVVFGNSCTLSTDCGAGTCASGVCCETQCETGRCNSTDSPGVCVQ